MGLAMLIHCWPSPGRVLAGKEGRDMQQGPLPLLPQTHMLALPIAFPYAEFSRGSQRLLGQGSQGRSWQWPHSRGKVPAALPRGGRHRRVGDPERFLRKGLYPTDIGG